MPNSREFTMSLSQQDWSLHRKGSIDQQRHQEKLKEAIINNLPHIIGNENIITSDGEQIVQVPIKSIDLPDFRYGTDGHKGTGMGDGDSKVGDILGQDALGDNGKGKQAGNAPGEDYYEVGVSIDTLENLMYQDLGLPYLKPKANSEIPSETVKFSDIRRKGVMSNLDKRRTILENLKRNAIHGKPRFQGIKDDDLRFKTWEEDIKTESNAVVLAMRDVSGSMGEFEKYITRSFYFWMVRFLRRKYNQVKIVFITHHSDAKEVDEESFFNLGESGGTQVSSAYQLSVDITKARYPSEKWNIYPYHFSDGDNWGEVDNIKCVKLIEEMFTMGANTFGYGEIREGGQQNMSSLMNYYQKIKNPRFCASIITDKSEVYPALKKFFNPALDLEE